MIPEYLRDNPDRRFICFKAPSGAVRVIQEVPKEAENDFVGILTRQEAWDAARSQLLPVVFMSKAGRQDALGRVFNPRVYERSIHTWLQTICVTSMDFEMWVEDFRSDPDNYSYHLDGFLSGSLAHYRQLLAAANLSGTSGHR